MPPKRKPVGLCTGWIQNDRLAGNCFAFYEALMIKSEKPPIFRSERETLKVTFLVFSGSSI
ncbi:MAG: hypothetical protein E5W30_15335, partial [Mesorhizobium sp.]